MRFADYPFLRYLPFILMGIFLGELSWMPGSFILLIFCGILLLSYVLLLSTSAQSNFSTLSALGYVLLVLYGTLLIVVKNESTSKIDFDLLNESDGFLTEVTEYDLEKQNSHENLLELIAVHTEDEWKSVSGKILVYHQSEAALTPGQLITFSNAPEAIPPPTNPHELDYRKYLESRGIYLRMFLGKEMELIASHSAHSSTYLLKKLRRRIALMLKDKIHEPESQEIALALLLGEKKSLDPSIRETYAQAGVMHILAVSGLHVGIIYALLVFILRPFKLNKKLMKIYLIGVIAVIWLYAILTGLSPSVVRASTMFSLLTLGLMRERKPSVFNILAFSAILMISFNPDIIYEVGFQLSYLSVAGIVLLQPLIIRLWLPSNKISYWAWELMSVSIAAQLATFPLSIYYFHVFPTYFLLGNLLILPLVLVIMQVGVPLMFLGWIPYVGDILGWLVGKLIWLQSVIASLIQAIPGSKLDRLTMGWVEMLLIWTAILVLVSWEMGSKRRLIWFSCFLITCWFANQIYKVNTLPSKQLITYSGRKGILLDFVFDRNLYSWNQGLTGSEISYLVDPNRLQSHLPLVPKVMTSVRLNDLEVSFPVTNWKLNTGSNTLHFENSPPKSVEKWELNKWQRVEFVDTLNFDGSAYRILF